MGDHAEKSAGTTGSRSLDQSAIDEALAAMQRGDPGNGSVVGQGVADEAAAPDGDGSIAVDADSQPPVRSNGGDTFDDVQRDGQEDLDAAIAAIQADVSDEEMSFQTGDGAPDAVEQANADASIPPGPSEADANAEVTVAGKPAPDSDSQEALDEAIVPMPSDAGEAAGAAAADDSGAQTDRRQDTEATTDAIASALASAPTQEMVENHVPEKTAAEPVAGEEMDSGIDVIDMTNRQGAPDTLGAPRDGGAESPLVEQTGSGSESISGGKNTFSDLDDSDLEDAGAGRAATEAEQLAAMTAAFDDENDSSEPGDGDPELAATIDADRDAASDAVLQKPVAGDAVVAEAATIEKSTASPKSAAGPKKLRSILLFAAVVIIGGAAFLGRDFYSAYREKDRVPVPSPAAEETAPHLPAPAVTAAVSMQPDPYQDKLEAAGRLRADLLAKKSEIDQLKLFYRDGISELEEELQQEATRQQINTFAEAVANHKIELDLRSIQRRWAYIDELEKPSNWLYQGSEELLFLSRRAQIDLQMTTIASGIELTRHTRHLNASLQKYQLSPDRLAIDPTESRQRSLEDIWNAISEQNKTIARHAVASGDQAIIADICDGATGRIAELKTLTIRASRCLSRIESSELFLNQLSSISPVAAKFLSNWKGQWLCLNGFRQLSPEVARHLFRWDGDWMSLNGLEEFPPEIGEMLLSWQGRQLELMGLVHDPRKMERIGYQQLADWEKSGGKLFVPESVRSEIDKLSYEPG